MESKSPSQIILIAIQEHSGQVIPSAILVLVHTALYRSLLPAPGTWHGRGMEASITCKRGVMWWLSQHAGCSILYQLKFLYHFFSGTSIHSYNNEALI